LRRLLDGRPGAAARRRVDAELRLSLLDDVGEQILRVTLTQQVRQPLTPKLDGFQIQQPWLRRRTGTDEPDDQHIGWRKRLD
jgi:hypothetical protein